MVICFIGDSIVNGVGDVECLGWAGRLCAETKNMRHAFTSYNLGVRKNSSKHVLERWTSEVESRLLPDEEMMLIFAFGVVDMAIPPGATSTNISLEQSVANARAVLVPASSRFSALFVGPTPVANPEFTSRIQQLDQKYADLCQELGVPYLRILPHLKESEIYQLDLTNGDGIHPAAAGYGLIFRLLEDWSAWKSWFPEKV